MSSAERISAADLPPRPDLALALEHHMAGRLDEAAQIYARLHAANRRDTDVLLLMGVLCCDLGLFEPACRFLEEALAFSPAFPEARRQLVVALDGLADVSAAAGQLAQAEQLLARALELAPGDAPSLQALGRVALQRGDAAAAEARFLASLAERPQHAQTLNWLGLARLQLEKYAEAEISLRQALRLQPELNQARNNLGLALYRRGRLGEAQACFEAALAQQPEYPKARINLASTLRTLGRYAEAQSELERVLAAQPDAADALSNLGAVFQDQGQSALALAALNRALALAPESPQIRWNLALSQLARGDFRNGWANFEARWAGCEHLRGGYKMPRDRAWRGESLHGRRLLLWTEQGFGDTLQFVRFAQDAAREGAIVSLLAQRELADLARSAPGLTHVEPWGGTTPAHDFHCPLMSLPHWLGISDAGQLHGTGTYLHAAEGRMQHWRQRLHTHPNLKVGLVWAGSSRKQIPELAAIDARRSIPLDRLAQIVSVPGCSFFSLQKGLSQPETEAVARAGVFDFSAEWRDFSDTAAVIANLDLVISVDTAVAHLTGALGKPVWLLNRYDTCWRWLLDRSDSPWYSTLRQFRQHRPGDWDPAIAAIAAALAEAAAAHAAATHAETAAARAASGPALNLRSTKDRI